MTVEQLQSVAPPEIIKEVESIKITGATEDLRKVISSLADDLEIRIGSVGATDTEKTALLNSMRTLNILMDLYFSLH